jgi:hypothetical protein
MRDVMNEMYSAIAAMLDDEPFDPAILAAALETPEGRDLLIDLVALRRLVQPPAAPPLSQTRQPSRQVWRWAAAAAIIMAAVSGYAVGQRQPAPDGNGVVSGAPAPTRVVETTTTWQPLPPGGLR